MFSGMLLPFVTIFTIDPGPKKRGGGGLRAKLLIMPCDMIVEAVKEYFHIM